MWISFLENKQNPPTNIDCAMADLECFEQSSKTCIFIQLLAQNFLDTNLNFHQHPAINAIRYKRCNHRWAFCKGHQLKMWFHSLFIICILSCIVSLLCMRCLWRGCGWPKSDVSTPLKVIKTLQFFEVFRNFEDVAPGTGGWLGNQGKS